MDACGWEHDPTTTLLDKPQLIMARTASGTALKLFLKVTCVGTRKQYPPPTACNLKTRQCENISGNARYVRPGATNTLVMQCMIRDQTSAPTLLKCSRIH